MCCYVLVLVRWEAVSSLERQLAGILLTTGGGGAQGCANASTALTQALIDALHNTSSGPQVRPRGRELAVCLLV
jgi:hypothetical protein